MQIEMETIMTICKDFVDDKYGIMETIIRVRHHNDILALCDQIEDDTNAGISFLEYNDNFGHTLNNKMPKERIATIKTKTLAQNDEEAIHKTFTWFLEHTV